MARRRSREHALQLLFQWDQRPAPHDEILKGYYNSLLVPDDGLPAPRDPFAEQLFYGTTAELTAIDAAITAHAANWRIERMPAVDRSILRLATYELLHSDLPPAVIMDEALELAGKFAGDESKNFINGVLNAIRNRPA